MASVLAEWPMVVYKTVGDSHVFSGPFAVADFAPGDGIDLVPNPHYPGAARRPEILVKKFADAQQPGACLRGRRAGPRIQFAERDRRRAWAPATA